MTLSDEGKYKCVAENVAGKTNRVTDVEVNGEYVFGSTDKCRGQW